MVGQSFRSHKTYIPQNGTVFCFSDTTVGTRKASPRTHPPPLTFQKRKKKFGYSSRTTPFVRIFRVTTPAHPTLQPAHTPKAPCEKCTVHPSTSQHTRGRITAPRSIQYNIKVVLLEVRVHRHRRHQNTHATREDTTSGPYFPTRPTVVNLVDGETVGTSVTQESRLIFTREANRGYLLPARAAGVL